MYNILVLDPLIDSTDQLHFLLKLAGYKCTLAHSVDEILNCIGIAKVTAETIDLIIIDSTINHSDGMLLMDEFTQGRTPLIIYRQKTEAELPTYLNKHVRVLHKQSLLPYLRSEHFKRLLQLDKVIEDQTNGTNAV